MTVRETRNPCAAALGTAAAILLTGVTSEASAATSFVPGIGANAAWTDNIDLAPPGQEQSGEVFDVEPRLSLTHDSAREHASLDYTLHALFFDGGHHDFLHTGSLVSQTQVIPGWLELDLGGERTQGVADPAAPANSQYLFPTGNLANFTSGEVRPILRHDFRAWRLEASYSRGYTQDEQIGGGPNGLAYRSNERDAHFAVSSIDREARLSWNADYERQQYDYESPYTQHFLYEQANAELGLLVTSSIRLIAQGGKESDPQNGIGTGGLHATHWAAGFDWSTGPRDELRLLVGHRFFGRTYEASWRRQSRLLNLQVSYTEQPTTQDATMLGQPLAAQPIVPVTGTVALTRLSPDVYLAKTLTGGATLTGRVTEVGLSVTSEQRTYYTIAGTPVLIVPRRRSRVALGVTAAATSTSTDDRERSASLYATRRIGPVIDMKVSATVGKIDLREGAQSQYTLEEYSATLTRRFGRYSSLYVRADHVRQHGQIAEYTANIVSLGFDVSLGNPATEGAQGFPGAPAARTTLPYGR